MIEEDRVFHQIPTPIRERMIRLEQLDAADRAQRVARAQRLRQIPPETGRFIAILAAAAPPGLHIEIGTSAGYSTMWLALACREKGCRLVTYELLEAKATLARETFAQTGLDDIVEMIQGDAREYLPSLEGISFCFLDAEKETYLECYEQVIPRMVSGGILIADNAISHVEELKPTLDRALSDARVDATIVPIGKGELVCRKRQLDDMSRGKR